MNVVCCQMDIAWEDKPANHERVGSMLRSDPPPAGALVVLPEMFATGFTMDVAAAAEPEDTGESHRFLSELSRELGVHLVAGVVTGSVAERGRNECVVYDPSGREIARYCKLHPFAPGGEAEHYGRGAATQLWRWEGFTVAPFICYDLRFPEIFRSAARRGADLFTVIANWPEARVQHWVTLLQARAIENQAYVVGVNRVGRDPALRYTGRTLVVGPDGAVLADGGEAEGLVTATLDREALRQYRERLPFLRDMRDEFVS